MIWYCTLDYSWLGRISDKIITGSIYVFGKRGICIKIKSNNTQQTNVNSGDVTHKNLSYLVGERDIYYLCTGKRMVAPYMHKYDPKWIFTARATSPPLL